MRELSSQIFREAGYGLTAPPLLLLSGQNLLSDRPVQLDQLGIDRALGLGLGLVDTLLKRLECLAIIGGKS
ncbi:hypothetical protein GCM10009813_35110 [Brevibacterium marinum]